MQGKKVKSISNENTWKEEYSVGRKGWSKCEMISLSMHARWTCKVMIISDENIPLCYQTLVIFGREDLWCCGFHNILGYCGN